MTEVHTVDPATGEVQETLLPDSIRVTKHGRTPTEGRQVDVGSSLVTSQGGSVKGHPHQPAAADAAVSGEIQGERVVNVVNLETGEVRESREAERAGAAFDEAMGRAEAAAIAGDAQAQTDAEQDIAAALAEETPEQRERRSRRKQFQQAVTAAVAKTRKGTGAAALKAAKVIDDYQAGRAEAQAEAEAARKAAEEEARRRESLGKTGRLSENLRNFGATLTSTEAPGTKAPAPQPSRNRSLAANVGRAAAGLGAPPAPRQGKNLKSGQRRPPGRGGNRKNKGREVIKVYVEYPPDKKTQRTRVIKPGEGFGL